MGFTTHHAIVVTSWSEEVLTLAHKKARELFGTNASEMTPKVINGVRSFFIAPDGSKDGWPESDLGDQNRASFLGYLDTLRYGDGSTPLDWIEVSYDESGKTAITARWSEQQRRKPGQLDVLNRLQAKSETP